MRSKQTFGMQSSSQWLPSVTTTTADNVLNLGPTTQPSLPSLATVPILFSLSTTTTPFALNTNTLQGMSPAMAAPTRTLTTNTVSAITPSLVMTTSSGQQNPQQHLVTNRNSIELQLVTNVNTSRPTTQTNFGTQKTLAPRPTNIATTLKSTPRAVFNEKIKRELNLNEQLIKLRQENHFLRQENFEMKTTSDELRSDLKKMSKLITTLEDMKTMTQLFIKKCKCAQNSNNNTINESKKLKTRINTLKAIYEQLKSETTFYFNANNNLINTSGGQTIKLSTSSSGQQSIRLIRTGGQTPIGTKQVFVQKTGQAGTGQSQLMVKTAQGLTSAPAGAKGIPAGQVVKLMATQTGQQAGTPTIIQASQSQQLYQIGTTGGNVSVAQIGTTASGQKVFTTSASNVSPMISVVHSSGTDTTSNIVMKTTPKGSSQATPAKIVTRPQRVKVIAPQQAGSVQQPQTTTAGTDDNTSQQNIDIDDDEEDKVVINDNNKDINTVVTNKRKMTPIMPKVTPIMPKVTPVMLKMTPIMLKMTSIMPKLTPIMLKMTPIVPKMTPITPQTKVKKKRGRKPKFIVSGEENSLDPKSMKKPNRCQWPGCEAVFRDRIDLENHMWRHTGEKLYSCDWRGCGKQFTTKCYMRKHQKTHLDPQRFKCEFTRCNAAFVNSHELEQHFKDDHKGLKPYTCHWPNCQKQCSSKLNLQMHHYSHKGPKYKCLWPGCEHRFIRKETFDKHVCEAHTGKMPYICEWPGCEFQTVYTHNLKHHKRTHTNEKPHKCDWPNCEWSFVNLNNLKKHMLRHTGERPYECIFSGCGLRFKSKRAMKYHSEKNHKL